MGLVPTALWDTLREDRYGWGHQYAVGGIQPSRGGWVKSVPAAGMVDPGIPDGGGSPQRSTAAGTGHGLCRGAGREAAPMP